MGVKMKGKTLFICLLILFCGANVSARPKKMTIPEFELNWANYENKIVRIEFDHVTNISQLDKIFYRATIWDKEWNTICVIFKRGGLNYMKRARKLKRKWYVYAIVMKTTIQDEYYWIDPMLKLIGSRRVSGGVKIRYKW